jgi:hypothetical protein
MYRWCCQCVLKLPFHLVQMDAACKSREVAVLAPYWLLNKVKQSSKQRTCSHVGWLGQLM